MTERLIAFLAKLLVPGKRLTIPTPWLLACCLVLPLGAQTVPLNGLRVWLKADAGVTKGAGDTVTAWNDQSGRGILFAPRGARPTWKATGVGGRPSIAFGLSINLLKSGVIDIHGGSNDLTVIVVFKPAPTQVQRPIMVDFDSGRVNGFSLEGDQLGLYRLAWKTNPADSHLQAFNATGQSVAGVPQMLTFEKKGQEQRAFFNGVLEHRSSVTASMWSPVTELGIGGQTTVERPFNGEISEVLIYNRALAEAERQALENELIAKYTLNDADQDGLFDPWEYKYFGSLIHGPNADPGGVGRTLLQSYNQVLSPWPTPPVSANLRVWYRSDLGVTKGSDRKVSGWVDLSGQAAHLRQSSSNAQPLWQDNILGSRPALQFSGSNLLKTEDWDLLSGSTDLSIFAVIAPEASQISGARVVDFDHINTRSFVLGQRFELTNRYSLYWLAPGESWQDGINQTVTGIPGATHILGYVKQGGQNTAFLNGVQQSSGPVHAALPSPIARLSVGATVGLERAFNGKIAEILIYNRALTVAERQLNDAYLKARYFPPTPPPGDTDADGLLDVWEQQYFGTLSYQPTEDPGQVGRSLLQSYQTSQSPWPAAVVNNGLRAWYRADLGVTKDASNKVGGWADLSGNGIHAVQSDGSKKPTWKPAEIGGKPALDFTASYLLSGNSDLLASSSDVTVLVVTTPNPTQGSNVALLSYQDSLGISQVGGINSYALNWSGSADGARISTGGGTARVIGFIKHGATVSSYLGGTLQSSRSDTTTFALTPSRLALGAAARAGSYGDYFSGKIAEILIYNRALSAAERQQLEASLISKYNLATATEASAVVGGGDQSLWIDGMGIARTWGRNSDGQLGDGTALDHTQPRRTTSIVEPIKTAALGEFHSLAVTRSGNVYAWGENYFGQLGSGTTVSQRTPILIPNLSNVMQVAAGEQHSLAVRSDGSVWAWGANQSGQLGDGTLLGRLMPVQISGLVNIIAVAAGAHHSAALSTDGTVWVWGSNQFGQVAASTAATMLRPVLIPQLTLVKALASGRQHLVALKTDGTIVAWGAGYAGQLGGGPPRGAFTPQPIAGLNNITAIFAGNGHNVAIANNGAVWAWGANEVGQVGDGTTTARFTPVALPFVGIVSAAVGRDHVVVAKGDGTLMAWGYNAFGQLGTSTTGQFSNVPVMVSPATD